MNRPINNKRYVAHFDMLGFKNATMRNPDEAWGALSDLRACMDRILKIHIKDISTDTIVAERIKAYIFSDTILIFTLQDKLQDLIAMLILASELFKDTLHTCIPLRGGISHGDFFFNSDLNLFCGIPFVRAYEIGENSQWSGIVIDDAVAEHYHTGLSHITRYDRPIIIKWDIPIKPNGKKNSWVINWPVIFSHNFNKKPPISIQDYYGPFERLFGPYDNLLPEVQAKYKNTVDFINSNLF